MNVLIAADARLYRTPDGKVWCKTIYGYDFGHGILLYLRILQLSRG